MNIGRTVVTIQNSDHKNECFALENTLREKLGKRKPSEFTKNKFRALALAKSGYDIAVPVILKCSDLSARRFIHSINQPDPVQIAIHGNLYRVKYPEAYELVAQAMTSLTFRRMPASVTVRRLKEHGVPCPSLQTIRRWKTWHRLRNRRCPRRREGGPDGTAGRV